MMAIKTELEPRQICFVTWWSSCSSASQLTDWLRAPDHTGVVWGLYTCCWSSLNISIPRLQEAQFETAHMWPSGYESVPPQFRPSLKTCFILVFIHPPAICSLRLKKRRRRGGPAEQLYNSHMLSANSFPITSPYSPYSLRLLMNPSTAL